MRSPLQRPFRRRMLSTRDKGEALRPHLPDVSDLQKISPFGPLKTCISLSSALTESLCLLKRLRMEKT